MMSRRLRTAYLHTQRHIALVQTELVSCKRTRQGARKGVTVRAHTHPASAAVDEKPAVPIFADRPDEKVTIIGLRSAHHVRVEPPAFRGVHHRINPQCQAAIGSHGLTVDLLADNTSPPSARDRAAPGRRPVTHW